MWLFQDEQKLSLQVLVMEEEEGDGQAMVLLENKL
jgi:hypothetical protein